jgi:metal-responsive CopG/Arc/MetJ family transcriptional regulator
MPDELFSQIEAAARRLRLSRSELYATAIAQFIESQRTDAVTDRLNEIYGQQSAMVDEAVQRAQLKTIEKNSY